MGGSRGLRVREKFSSHLDIPPPLDSMARKRSAKAAEQSKRVELALQDLAAGVFTSVKGAAKAHSAPESTVRGRWKGGKSQAEGNEWQQLL